MLRLLRSVPHHGHASKSPIFFMTQVLGKTTEVSLLKNVKRTLIPFQDLIGKQPPGLIVPMVVTILGLLTVSLLMVIWIVGLVQIFASKRLTRALPT